MDMERLIKKRGFLFDFRRMAYVYLEMTLAEDDDENIDLANGYIQHIELELEIIDSLINKE
jgi:hypothetical protein